MITPQERSRIEAAKKLATQMTAGSKRVPNLYRRSAASGPGAVLICRGRVIFWSSSSEALDEVVAHWYGRKKLWTQLRPG